MSEPRDENGRTALHRAALAAEIATTRELLGRGSDPNARDFQEYTPLHLVCGARNDDDALAVAKLLIEGGADPRAKNATGHTPAQMGHASDVQAFLRKEARKRPKPGAIVAESLAYSSLKSDLEKRIDDACRTIPRVTATHDDRRKREEPRLVFRTGPLEFARIDRTLQAFEVREGEGWRAIPFAELPADLSGLVTTSLAIAKAPCLRVVKLVKPHPILKGALEKATPEERPPEPRHLGGHTPVCPSLTAAALTIWMTEMAIEATRPPDAAHARDLLDVARGSIQTPKSSAYGPLLSASRDRRGDSAAMALARRASGAAATLLKGKHDVVWVHAKAAAVRMVPILREVRASRARLSVTDFIRELDRRILVGEMVSAATRHAKAGSSPLEIAQVLWRGPDLFLGHVDGERFALVGKLGKSWAVLTGTRDEMLASVPDFAFEDATRAFLDTNARK